MPNIAWKLHEQARSRPDAIAVVEPVPKRSPGGKRSYRTITFARLDAESDKIARAMLDAGLRPGMRLALMVRQGIDFITLVFALFKSGATLVLIDPGMGLKQMIACLAEVRLDGFVAISKVHALRCVLRRKFPQAKFHLTVGRRWFWGGLSLDAIRKRPDAPTTIIDCGVEDPAAIIFTSGSTGVAKGVLFTHGIFETQVEEIQSRLNIEPGTVDLACFPFFGLFNAAMGVCAVIPEMDSSRPGSVDPRNILEAIRDWNVRQSFGSPALWNRVISHCEETSERLTPLCRVVSAGAPVPVQLLRRLKAVLPEPSAIYTPYGATEALPVALIEADEILAETAAKTEQGAGICVGTRFGSLSWKVIEISDDPIARMDDARECEQGRIGELVVEGPQVTKEYVTRTESNRFAKIRDSEGRIWHRMGDVGYRDAQDRFWFCGRKAHRVETDAGTLFSIPCESIFNNHPNVSRSALVGVPVKNETTNLKEPLVFIEPVPGAFPKNEEEKTAFLLELRAIAESHPLTRSIRRFLFDAAFPVDVRHNAKINREELARRARET